MGRWCALASLLAACGSDARGGDAGSGAPDVDGAVAPVDAAADATTGSVTHDASVADEPCTGREGAFGHTLADIVQSACRFIDDGGEAAVLVAQAKDGCGETRVDTPYHHGGETFVFDADGRVVRWVNWGDAFLETSGARCVNTTSRCMEFAASCAVCASPQHATEEPCPAD